MNLPTHKSFLGHFHCPGISPRCIAFLQASLQAGLKSSAAPEGLSFQSLPPHHSRFFGRLKSLAGWVLSEGVESRERARIFGPGILVCQKERATFPSKISTPGKFCVLSEAPTPRGTPLIDEKSDSPLPHPKELDQLFDIRLVSIDINVVDTYRPEEPRAVFDLPRRFLGIGPPHLGAGRVDEKEGARLCIGKLDDTGFR